MAQTTQTLDPARRAAAALLSAVTDEGKTLETALETARSYQGLEGRDRAFARAIASATLRRLGSIDAVLGQYMARPLGPGAEAARAILRTGAAQILAMAVAPHAAVSAAVALANSARSARPFAGMINAVLRKASTEGHSVFAALPAGTDIPDWLFTRWRATYGQQTAQAIALALHQEPPLDLTPKQPEDDWPARLGARVGPFGSVRLDAGQDLTSLYGFEQGAWWVQDAAATLPAKMLGDVRGKTVLDLCAAPGGKTMQLAAAGAHVVGVDKDDKRLDRLRANLLRTNLPAELVHADILDWAPPAPVDAILLDAPCTATGTLRRHPDAAWLRRPSDIQPLAALQQALLARCAGWLKPQGRLVYAVCSLEPEEGEGVAATLNALQSDPISAHEIGGETQAITPAGHIRTHPGLSLETGGMDGFFIARFRAT
jgi:16S rRNA (cytosine967-C5)-methyltransferase